MTALASRSDIEITHVRVVSRSLLLAKAVKSVRLAPFLKH